MISENDLLWALDFYAPQLQYSSLEYRPGPFATPEAWIERAVEVLKQVVGNGL